MDQNFPSFPPPPNRAGIWFLHLCRSWLPWYNEEVSKIDHSSVFDTHEEKMDKIRELQKTMPKCPMKPKGFIFDESVVKKAAIGQKIKPEDLIAKDSVIFKDPKLTSPHGQ